MSLAARIGFGIPAAIIAGAVGGPTLAYIAWKGVGFAATGNPLYLVPGGSTLSDGAGAVGELLTLSSDTADLASMAADAGDAGSTVTTELADRNVWDQPTNQDIWQREPVDIHNNAIGRNHLGEMPTDIQGKQL